MLHFPGEEKAPDFEVAFQKKVNDGDLNFHGVWFPKETFFGDIDFNTDAEFGNATFTGEAYFRGAVFTQRANFSNAKFNAGADFAEAKFNANAEFGFATFADQAFFSSSVIAAAAHFYGITFDGMATFRDVTFRGEANFESSGFKDEADFSGAIFKEFASFRPSSFEQEALFDRCIFTDSADFGFCTFKADAYFTGTTFVKGAHFDGCNFGREAAFSGAIFGREADFNSAIIADRVSFAGGETRGTFTNESSLNLQFARIEKPKHLSFHTLSLRPHWFINVDAREFEFLNVRWESLDVDEEVARLKQSGIMARPQSLFTTSEEFTVHANGGAESRDEATEEEGIEEEDAEKEADESIIGEARKEAGDQIEEQTDEGARSPEGHEAISPHRLLAVTCRQLAVNAEENQRYEEASSFRYMAMDVRRREGWRGPAFWRLSWWYWLASGYGERVWQAFLVLIGLWLIGALLYSQVRFAPDSKRERESRSIAEQEAHAKPLKFKRALIYSAGVITLQKPEPRPVGMAGQTILTLESIMGPIQAALLALAVRRKFMR